jgi:hypothetical protein
MLGIFVFNGHYYVYLHCSMNDDCGRPRTDHGQSGADIWSCLFSQVLFSAKLAQPWPRPGHYLDSTSPRLARTPSALSTSMAKVESTDDNLYDGNF